MWGVDDFSDYYDCNGSVTDLNGSTVTTFICGGESTPTELDVQNGTFASGSSVGGKFSGTVYMPPQGMGFDSMRAAVNLNAAPTVWAAISGDAGGVFRSTDAGSTWTQLSNGIDVGG